MFKRLICVLVMVSFVFYTSGCASYHMGRLPSPYIIDHPEAMTQAGVSVVAKFLSSEKALTTFDCEMYQRRIQPVFIVIENKSDIPYSFTKADTAANYIPAGEVSKKCARSTMGRVLGYGFLALLPIVWIVFLPMLIGEWINTPKLNSRMRSDYTDAEIPDATIGTGRSISGIMFILPLTSDDSFIIPLVNRQTGEKLLFKFRDYSAPAKEIEKSNNIPEAKQPTTNFSPKSNSTSTE